MKKNANGYRTWDVQMVSCALHHEVNNDKCHNFYFHAKVRVHTGRNTFFLRNFVIWFDSEELYGYFEGKKRVTKSDVKEYAREVAWNFVRTYIGEKVTRGECNSKSLLSFTEACVKTIENFNGRVAA